MDLKVGERFFMRLA
jgi:hypothetical protein